MTEMEGKKLSVTYPEEPPIGSIVRGHWGFDFTRHADGGWCWDSEGWHGYPLSWRDLVNKCMGSVTVVRWGDE